MQFSLENVLEQLAKWLLAYLRGHVLFYVRVSLYAVPVFAIFAAFALAYYLNLDVPLPFLIVPLVGLVSLINALVDLRFWLPRDASLKLGVLCAVISIVVCFLLWNPETAETTRQVGQGIGFVWLLVAFAVLTAKRHE